jgi:fatty acid desaturase
MTSQDYGHGSWFWTVFSGSLNYQVVHHLFPGINQYYYPKIAPLIMHTCAEFGITYHVKVRSRRVGWVLGCGPRRLTP